MLSREASRLFVVLLFVLALFSSRSANTTKVAYANAGRLTSPVEQSESPLESPPTIAPDSANNVSLTAGVHADQVSPFASLAMWLSENWTDVLTAIVAIYGALLATLTYRRQNRLEQKSLRVSLSNGVFTGDLGLGARVLIIEIVNTGKRPVTVTGAGFQTSQGNSLVVFRDASNAIPFPRELSDSQSVRVYYDWTHFKQSYLETRAGDPTYMITRVFAQDSESQYYYAPPPDWLKKQLDE